MAQLVLGMDAWITKTLIALAVMLMFTPAAAENSTTGELPDRGIQRIVIDSKHLNYRYEVLIASSTPTQMPESPVPCLVVLDGFLLGMTAIETARLLTSAGEIEDIIIATVSADGPFAMRTARRSPDFSADVENLEEQESIQGIVPQLAAAGIALEDVFGHSDKYRQFLSDELLPELKKIPGVDMSRLSLFGHSAAGAFALEALLEGDLPFQDYIVGEAGTFMLFGTEQDLIRKAISHKSLPAKRLLYADSSDTMTSSTKDLFAYKQLLSAIKEDVGVTVETRHYNNESHTTMIPAFIKDALLYLYGTGHTYSERFAERMGR